MYVLVAVPVPQLDLLTYAVPSGTDVPSVGARVVVPLGKRSVTGIVVEIARHPPAGVQEHAIKAIARTLDAGAFLPADVVGLARWTAEYYLAGPGEAITAILPPKTRGERADAHKKVRVASISAPGMDLVDSEALTVKQREALGVLRGSPQGLAVPGLLARGVSAAVLARLAKAGLVTIRQESVERDPFAWTTFTPTPTEAGRVLTDEQSAALARLETLAAADRFHVALSTV